MLAAGPVMQAALWTIVLIGMSVALVFGLLAIRRWMVGANDRGAGGITLAELREMVRTGVISAEEYERAREAAIRVAQRAIEERTPAAPLDSAGRISDNRHRRADGAFGMNPGGTGRIPPANREPDRKPPSPPSGGQESGGPDR